MNQNQGEGFVILKNGMNKGGKIYGYKRKKDVQ